MSHPTQKIKLEFTYQELKLLSIFLDLDSAEGEDAEILERIYSKLEGARAKLDPEEYKRGI